MITNVYIDGFNLFYGALKGTPYKWLDLSALCQRLLPDNEIHRIRFFTARVAARPNDPRRSERQQTYLRALRTVPNLTIHEGEFYISYPRMMVYEPETPVGARRTFVQVVKSEEKGSDVNIATYLVLDACRGDCEVAVLVTNDSDLREPLRVVRDELGIVTGVVNPQRSGKRNRALDATFFRSLRESTLRQCQFPVTITDANGHKIRKPADW
jgi:uncharacterized LabA/DUF88 family protein